MPKILTAARSLLFSGALLGLLTASSPAASAQMQMQQAVAAAQSAKVSSSGRASDMFHQGQGPTMVPPHFAQLKLAPGFLLSLNVLDDPDFTGSFRVDEAGNIDLPQLGSIHVAGKIVTDAREEITKDLLDKGILKDPQVELNIVEYTAPQVTVLGAVTRPGVFPLLAPEGLGDVLALAGDTTILAGDRIEITTPKMGGDPQSVHYYRGMDTKLLDKVVIQPGDTVHVAQAGIVYVLGGVNRPGGYVMEGNGNLSVLQAISIAGGTGLTASIKSIYVMRRDDGNATSWLELPYRKMTQGKIADVQLHKNDVVYVPTSRLKSAFLSSEGVLAAVTSASIYAGVIY